ncbi:MAG: hypothetical protein H7Z42_01630 [Roseiflexaceae bacterium]|nr:hypothetical protein [Roseiflexaceae bacterium]
MDTIRRFDLRAFALMLGAATLGLLWANYNRGLASSLAPEAALRPHVWVIFAIPFALLLGWLLARRHEAGQALLVCFCVYFFSTFIAARYESCAVVTGSFDLGVCFTGTAEAQELAQGSGHALYFQSILIIQSFAALVIALQRAVGRSTMPDQVRLRQNSEFRIQNSD